MQIDTSLTWLVNKILGTRVLVLFSCCFRDTANLIISLSVKVLSVNDTGAEMWLSTQLSK